jgi:hypothetical protein
VTPKTALAQLRHLYQQMLDGAVHNTAEAARGLLGPALEALEPLYTPESIKAVTPVTPDATHKALAAHIYNIRQNPDIIGVVIVAVRAPSNGSNMLSMASDIVGPALEQVLKAMADGGIPGSPQAN